MLSSISTPAEVERAEAEAQQRRASIDDLLDHGASPMLTDLEGWSNPRIHPTGSSAMTWVRSEAGAVATILVSADAEAPVTDDWCHFIARDGDASSPTADALPDWCVRTETGWERADGTGVVIFDAGSLIAINPAAEAGAAQAGGVSSATARDIALLAESLRPMTDAELHEHVVPVYDAVETPVIDTPGL